MVTFGNAVLKAASVSILSLAHADLAEHKPEMFENVAEEDMAHLLSVRGQQCRVAKTEKPHTWSPLHARMGCFGREGIGSRLSLSFHGR